MNLAGMTLDTFLCSSSCTMTASPSLPFSQLVMSAPPVSHHIRTLGQGYELFELQSPADVAITHRGTIVGLYFGQVLEIDPAHRRKGLSVPMVLAAAPHRQPPTSRIMSDEGRRALTYAWEVATGRTTDPWP